MKRPATIHSDLFIAQKLFWTPSELYCKNIVVEHASQDYGACTFELNNHRIQFRVAKITPTKIGQFVTFWKRLDSGPIMPYNTTDSFDFLIVSVRDAGHYGQFIFPKSILHEKGLISKEGCGGKRAMRVYPSWDVADNNQAKKTQSWQLHYFFEIDTNKAIDENRVKKLFE